MHLRSTTFRLAWALCGLLWSSSLAAGMPDSLGLYDKIDLVRALPLAALDPALEAQPLGDLLDAVGDPGDRIHWKESKRCGSGRGTRSVCLEFVSESELDTTARLLFGFSLADSGAPVRPRFHSGEFQKNRLSSAYPLRELGSKIKARDPQAHFAFSVIDIRRGNSTDTAFQVTGDSSLPKSAQAPLRSVARLLDSLWKVHACGAPSDTFELKMLVVKRKQDNIQLVRLTHVDMYQGGGAIPRLMSLGRTFANSIPGDCAVRIVHTGSPICP